MEHLPLYLSILFLFIAIRTISWFYQASKSKVFLGVSVGWLNLQCFFGWKGIYQDSFSMPPKIMLLGVLPPLLIIIGLFITQKGKVFIDKIDLRKLTFFHSIRIFVEIGLALLYHEKAVSVLMTFEGTNFDIVSGLSAPILGFLAFKDGLVFKKKLLLLWNFVCLGLLLNVVITAAFSIPSPFQQFAFEQPNLAVLYFPFNVLPTVIVPLVLLAHLVAIRQLLKKEGV